MTAVRFVLGDWRVDPQARSLVREDEQHTLEPRTMDLLVLLCTQPGEVFSAEQLLSQLWPEQPSGDNPVHKHIALLRRALGDSATAPRYIETLRKRGYRIVASVRSLDAAQPQARAGAWTGGCPFRGLQAFDERHADVFYGREIATQSLWQTVQTQLAQGESLCLLLGPSGSGKTSLLRAGLVPHWLAQGTAAPRPLHSAAVLDLGDVSPPELPTSADGLEPQSPASPSPDSAAHPSPDGHADTLLGALHLALAACLLDFEVEGRPLLPGASAHSLAQALRHNPAALATELHACLRAAAPGSAQDRVPVLLLVLDRLEALFNLCLERPGVAGQWLATLQALGRSGVLMVVAVCRNDYYPQLAAQPWLMQAKARGAQLDLAPPGAADIAQMVRLPARAAGLSFEQDAVTQQRLDDVLVDAASRSPDALPLLQYALQQLYEQRDAHGQLSFAAYRRLGGMADGLESSQATGGLEGLIAAQAEQLLQGLSPQQQAGLPQVLSLLVTLGEDESAPIASHRARWSELRSAAERELVQALVDARLLVSDTEGGDSALTDPGFRVAHEALLRRWPRVTEWISQHRQDLHTRARLRQQVQRWLSGGRVAEFLWPKGRQLQAAQSLAQSGLWQLTADEQAFLQASGRRVRWAARLRGGALVLLGLLTVLSALMAWRAEQAQQMAQAKRVSSERLLGYMLGEFSEQLRPEGRLALLESVSQQALVALGDEADVPRLTHLERLQRAKALLLLGEVQLEKQNTAVAEPAFRAALALVKPPKGMSGSLQAAHYKVWGAAEFWLGEVARHAGQLDRAEQHQLAYRAVCQQWQAAWPQDEEVRLESAMAELNLGALALRRMAPDKALRFFATANDKSRQLLARRPEDPSLLDQLVGSLTWSMEAAVFAGQHEDVLNMAQEVQTLLVRWQAVAPKDQRVRAAEAVLQDWRSAAWSELKQVDKALMAQKQVLQLWSRLSAHDPANTAWQIAQLRAQINLWLLQAPGVASGSALSAFEQRLRSVQAQSPDADWQPVTLKLALLLARQEMHAGRASDALQMLKQAPPRPKTGLLNLRWSDLQAQAEWDAMWLQLLQAQRKLHAAPGATAAHSQACVEVSAFWAPLQGTPLARRFGVLTEQIQHCRP